MNIKKTLFAVALGLGFAAAIILVPGTAFGCSSLSGNPPVACAPGGIQGGVGGISISPQPADANVTISFSIQGGRQPGSYINPVCGPAHSYTMNYIAVFPISWTLKNSGGTQVANGSFTTAITQGGVNGTWNCANGWSPAERNQIDSAVTTINTASLPNGTYALAVSGAADNGLSPAVTVSVNIQHPAPAVTLTASPNPVAYNTASTLTWTVSGPVTSCTASGAWSGAKSVSGGSQSTGNLTSAQTYNLSCTGPGGTTPVSRTVTVMPPPSVGTINVTSESSVNGSNHVPATWLFSGPNDPCTGHGGSCSNVSQATYSNVSTTGSYTLNPQYANSSVYVLHSVEQQHIAQNDFFHALLGKIGGLLFTPAFAERTCVGLNTTPDTSSSACPATQTYASVSLLNNGDTGNFIIFWDPVANIAISPGGLTLSNGAGNSSQVTVSNSGGAPDSSMTWTSSITYADGSGWLTVSPSSGGPLANNASQQATVTADSTGLVPGSYKATVKFDGVSVTAPPSTPHIYSSLSVTFNVSSSGGGSNPTITINTTQPTAAGVPVDLTCTGGVGSYSWTAPGSTNTSGTGSNFQTTYSTPNNYQVTCTSGGASTSTILTITNDCTFGANPGKVVPPQTSTLSWQCVPGTAQPNSCNIYNTTNGTVVGTGLAASGTMTVSPQANSIYTLVCQANGSSYNIPAATTSVTVQGPSVIEGNPGSASSTTP